MRRLLLLVLPTVIISTNFVFANVYDLSQINNCKMVTEYSAETSLDNMDTVTFGSYYQSSSSSKEPIEWIVLDRKGNNALLLSKYILDCKKYDDNYNNIPWEKSTLRYWLNSTFVNTAFNSNEQEKINFTTVINNKVDNKSIDWKNTNDKIFCLSVDEVKNYFKADKNNFNSKIATKGTNYSKRGNNLHVNTNASFTGTSTFFLRSIGIDFNLHVSCITEYGQISGYWGTSEMGVRPALWVTIPTSTSQSNNTANGIITNNVSATTNNNQIPNSNIIVTSDEVDGIYYIDDNDNTRIVVYFNNPGGKKIKDGTKRNLNKYVYVVYGSYEPIPILVEKVVDNGVATVYIPKDYRNGWTKSAAESVHNKQASAYIAEIANYTPSYSSGMTMSKNEIDKSLIKNGWYGDSYYRNNALVRNEWLQYDNDWYFVGSDGAIVKNQWVQGKYVGSDGKMYAGKQTPDGKYVGMDGTVVNVSNDLKKSIEKEAANPDSWYKTQSGLWYYFENDRTTFKKGWFLDARDKQYYYLDPVTGIMQVGWKNIDGKDYYFNESHDNVPNWYETGNGFFESYGKKVKAYGSMYASEKTPDGYWVNYNGEYIKNGNFILAMNPKKLITIIVGIIVLFMGYNVTRKRLKNRNNEENNT